tara:strand:- start:2569 stop:2865 length:297 start_codon:yes stop_codon:yes gene_type:complete
MSGIAVDYYVNWDLAREQLLDISREVMSAIRVCDVAMQVGDSTHKEDLLARKMMEIFPMDVEQVSKLSAFYVELANAISQQSQYLNNNEINREVTGDA